MLNKEIKELSVNLRKMIEGENIDLRDNKENSLSKLKNDIHTLVSRRNEEVNALKRERDALRNTLVDLSHQLKTPLASIGIMLDLFETAPEDKRREFASNIRKSLSRVEWLVSALLKMAKLNSGAIALKCEEINAEDIIANALEPLQILLELKAQSVAVSGGAVIRCDKFWTAEALANIVKNASEHSPDGSEMRIESGSSPICSWISVTDCGEGIKRSEIANIFRRFHQGSRSKTGYGIGLPLALSIMNAQGGDIEVANVGNGSEFTLKFYRK